MNQPRRRTRLAVLPVASLCATASALLTGLTLPASAQESLARFDAPVVVTGQTTSLRTLLDLDGDGDKDAVDWLWTNLNGLQVRVGGWINDGSGGLTNAWNVPLTFTANPVGKEQDAAVGNLDGDAREDFALSFGERVYVFTSNGAAPPTQVDLINIPAAGLSLVLEDFNDDGFDDLATADGTAVVWINIVGVDFTPAEPAWDTIGPFLPASEPDDLHVLQFDGDGLPDLADIGGDFVHFYTIVNGVKTGTQSLAHGLGTITTGAMTTLTTGDVDADGDDDAVVFDIENNRCAVLRHGPSGWSAEPVQPNAGPATSLVDVNGDGALDGVACMGGLTVAKHGGGGPTPNLVDNFSVPFAVSLNDGTGNFPLAFGIPTLGGAGLAGVADMDGDGDADLVSGRAIYYAQGPITTAPLPLASLDAAALWPTEGFTGSSITDGDNDGDPDVRFGILQRTINAGDCSFALQPAPPVPPVPSNKKWLGPGVPGDFDGDGDVDLLVSRWQGMFQSGIYLDNYVFRNNGSGGAFQAVQANDGSYNMSPGLISVWDEPEAALVADADGDGDLDVFRFTDPSAGANRLSLNDGTGFFTLGGDIAPGRVQHVALLNADALPDLVIVSNNVAVHFGSGGGLFNPPVTLSTTVQYGDRVGLMDVDDNGALDVVATAVDTGAIEVFLNDGAGIFTLDNTVFAAYPLFPGSFSWPRRLVAADMDADGRQDLLAYPAGTSLYTTWVLVRNTGGRGWTAAQQVMTPGAVADFDGDGDEDVTIQQLQASVSPSRIARNLTFSGDEVGLRRQYGTGTAGTGGVTPVLGATGPFRPGETAALRLMGLNPSKIGIVTVGLTESALPNTPWMGSTGWNWPWVLFFTLPSPAGQPGVPGSASLVLPFVVPASLAGVGNLYHQIWWADNNAPFNRSSSNGLLIDYD